MMRPTFVAPRRHARPLPQRPDRRQPRATCASATTIVASTDSPGRRRLRLGRAARAQQARSSPPTSPRLPPAAWATPTGDKFRSRRCRSDERQAARIGIAAVRQPTATARRGTARAFRITTIRIVSQVFFFALFMFLAVGDLVQPARRLPGLALPRGRPARRLRHRALHAHGLPLAVARAVGPDSHARCSVGSSATGCARTAPCTSSSAGCSTSAATRTTSTRTATARSTSSSTCILDRLPGAGRLRLAADRPARSDLSARPDHDDDRRRRPPTSPPRASAGCLGERGLDPTLDLGPVLGARRPGAAHLRRGLVRGAHDHRAGRA